MLMFNDVGIDEKHVGSHCEIWRISVFDWLFHICDFVVRSYVIDSSICIWHPLDTQNIKEAAISDTYSISAYKTNFNAILHIICRV